MTPVKKIKNIKLNIIDATEVFEALDIRTLVLDTSKSDDTKQVEQNNKLSNLKEDFQNKYRHPWIDTVTEVWRWYAYIFKGKDSVQHQELYKTYIDSIKRTEKEPMKAIKYEKKILLLRFEKKAWDNEFERSTSPEWIDIDTICKWQNMDRESAEKLPLNTAIRTKSNVIWIVVGQSEWREAGEEWIFKENLYEVAGNYTDEQIQLLVLEEFDKERRYFEKLKTKYDSENLQSSDAYSRPRIPESVRIEVWRRDGGKCARCGSREKLEYDHIVPISRGGSNTARNIELLCEKHNRSKSNNVV